MKVRFWGVRGSCPSPIGSEDIRRRLREALGLLHDAQPELDLSDEAAVEAWLDALPLRVTGAVGSNTSCVEMRTDEGELYILDMGSGLRALGNHLMQGEFGQGQGRARIFLSHFHWDHIQGWPFFKPAYVPGNRFDLYARHPHLQSRLKRQQSAPFFPPAAWENMNADLEFHQLPDAPQVFDAGTAGSVRVSSLELDHPSKAYAYRFETENSVLIYASDSAYRRLDEVALQPYVEFFRDADLLIFDAQFSLRDSFARHSWGHSSAIIGLELACRANVKRLALFHHDPDADDARLEQLQNNARHYATSLPCTCRRPDQVEIVMAREGECFQVGR